MKKFIPMFLIISTLFLFTGCFDGVKASKKTEVMVIVVRDIPQPQYTENIPNTLGGWATYDKQQTLYIKQLQECCKDYRKAIDDLNEIIKENGYSK